LRIPYSYRVSTACIAISLPVIPKRGIRYWVSSWA